MKTLYLITGLTLALFTLDWQALSRLSHPPDRKRRLLPGGEIRRRWVILEALMTSTLMTALWPLWVHGQLTKLRAVWRGNRNRKAGLNTPSAPDRQVALRPPV